MVFMCHWCRFVHYYRFHSSLYMVFCVHLVPMYCLFSSIKVISREDDIVIFIFQGMIQTCTYNIYNLKQKSFVHINMAYTMKEFNFVLHIFMLLMFYLMAILFHLRSCMIILLFIFLSFAFIDIWIRSELVDFTCTIILWFATKLCLFHPHHLCAV
jgi:hypothetical protein